MRLISDKKEIIMYIIVGCATTIVSLAVFYGLIFKVLDQTDVVQLQIANILSWICGVIFAFYANRRIVFKNMKENVLLQLMQFGGARVGTLFIENISLFVLVSIVGLDARIIKILLMGVTTIGNYLISKLWVFREN